MTRLAVRLRERIARIGPITLDEYMSLALGDPDLGYYPRHQPIGRSGDFTTAPEVSQIFGELLGLWCVDLWARAGRPCPVGLVELGPGRGTLMADALRAAAVVPAFIEATNIHLVETSPVLRAAQRDALAGRTAAWHERIDELPSGPKLILANEFFDALPVRQFVKTGADWTERSVGLAPDGETLVFVAGGPAGSGTMPAVAEDGAVAEQRPAAERIVGDLARGLCADGGALLLLDYGYVGPALGDTLQAVRGHVAVHPLAFPGEADLTAHVDFAALAAAATDQGASVRGPIPQADFLRRLGAEARGAALARTAAGQTKAVLAGLQRLIDPGQMGTLFKALCVAHPDWPAPDGFSHVSDRL